MNKQEAVTRQEAIDILRFEAKRAIAMSKLEGFHDQKKRAEAFTFAADLLDRYALVFLAEDVDD